VRAIGGGSSALNAENASAVAAFDDATYREIWKKQVGEGTPPSVDFAKEAVVFLFAGMRNTAGYAIETRGVSLDGDALVVDAVVSGPPRGAMTAQVITYPYAIVAVTPRNFRSVRWHEASQTSRER
ncbi:MAG TPA: protease complex subunit PrcB family protein, partial [Thermoanaerobaculia bacterium]|nr:protease complex subunit PrcB family protein [Thermoanaerobaculia bacterium]